MQPYDISPTTILQPPSAPLDYPGGDIGILALHGFTGVPGDLKYLAERLAECGFTVAVPRLPGHGTNLADFRTTSWKDWLRRAIDAYLDLRHRCSIVHVTGLSMGGVLAIILAAMFDVERIALAAPAITTTNRLLPLTPFLRFFVRHGAERPLETYDDPGYRALAPEYWKYDWIGQVASLDRLRRLARQRLGAVHSRTLTIVSEKDNAVPLTAADIIENGVASARTRRIVLKESGHIVVNDVERSAVADAITGWFSGD